MSSTQKVERWFIDGIGSHFKPDLARGLPEFDEQYVYVMAKDYDKVVAEMERLRAALELACPVDPFDGGDLPCRFCGIDPGSAHKSNCAWVVARGDAQ